MIWVMAPARRSKLSRGLSDRIPPKLVKKAAGPMITARRADGSRVTRNVSMFRSLPYEPPPLQSDVEGDVDDDSGAETTPPTAAPTSRRRRSRSVSRGDRHVFASRRNACLSTCRHYMYNDTCYNTCFE